MQIMLETGSNWLVRLSHSEGGEKTVWEAKLLSPVYYTLFVFFDVMRFLNPCVF